MSTAGLLIILLWCFPVGSTTVQCPLTWKYRKEVHETATWYYAETQSSGLLLFGWLEQGIG